MRKFTNYLILLFFIVFLYSCTIKLPNDGNGDGDGNSTPTPENPTPFNGATGISLTPQLSWQCTGSYGNNLRFDVYLDTIPQPFYQIISNISEFSHTIYTPLAANKTYYWKIVAKNDNGESASNVWRFTTGTSSGGLPPTPDNPNPSNGAIGIPLLPQLSWDCNGPNTNNLRFDVYLDSNSPPNVLKVSNTNNLYYAVTTPLTTNKMYFWKVVARNDYGESVSNVWHFTTNEGMPTNGLLAYYPFNGNVNDESGNLNHGQNFGASLTMDRFFNLSRAYGFNGSFSYINIPNSTSLQPYPELTLSAWVKFSNINNTGSILAKGSDSEIGWYSLRYESSGHKLDFQINFTDYVGGPRMTVSTHTTLQNNVWYNVIGTFDGYNMTIYLNGQSENSMSVFKTLGSNLGDLQIGSCAEGYYFNGAIDDIRIYKSALNYSDIQLLYHEGRWVKK